MQYKNKLLEGSTEKGNITFLNSNNVITKKKMF